MRKTYAVNSVKYLEKPVSPAKKLPDLVVLLLARKLKKASGVSKMCRSEKACATKCSPKELTSLSQQSKAIFSVR